jgi:NAD(P)-dependent dehydrogenase (short-subunit alcohol dehydrogenase family)
MTITLRRNSHFWPNELDFVCLIFPSISLDLSNMKRLEGRVALITGASRGIGAEVAVQYAEEGAHVILVARTVGGLEEIDDRVKAAGGGATLVPLDLTDSPAIDRLGGAIADRWGRLDILVANAGMLGGTRPVGHFTPEVWEQVFAVNVHANWRLIRSLDALLRASDAGRAIFVTSRAATLHRPYLSAYGASKAALDAMVKTYAGELEKTDVKVNLLDPGVVRTEMRAQLMPGDDPDTLPPPEALGPLFVEMAEPSFTRNGEIVSFVQDGA